MNEVRTKRNFDDGGSHITSLSKEIEILKDIYEHKGTHPEVMLDSSIKMAESPDFLKEYDENLLCEVDEVNWIQIIPI